MKQWMMELQESVCLACNNSTVNNELYCSKNCNECHESQFELQLGEKNEGSDSAPASF